MCTAALPQLASQERLRAIRAHIAEFHPGETVKSLYHKSLRGFTRSPAFCQKQHERNQKNKSSLFPTHNLVLVPFRPYPVRQPAVIWHKTFCKDCFAKFTGKSCTKPDVTCADRQQELVDNKRALARKRGWWTRLKISDPDQAQEFLKACQLSEAEVDERLKVGIATYSARKWKLTKASRDKAADTQSHDPNKGRRIGEASHPGPGPLNRSLSVISLNTQGGPGVWRLFNIFLLESSVDIALLQEVSFTPNEARAFGRCAAKKGFNFYFEPGPPHKGCQNKTHYSGGVGILVKKHLRQRCAYQAGNDDAQILTIWTCGWLIGSVYAPPRQVSPHAASTLLTEVLIASENLGTNIPWLVAGDFNETPDDSHFCDVAGGLGGSVCRLHAATRWESDREIDFFVSSKTASCGQVSSPPIHISDHRIISMDISASVFAPICGKLPKSPKLFCPTHLGPEEWRETVSLAWNQCTFDNPDMLVFGDVNVDVQTKWDLLQVLIQDTFRLAFKNLDSPVHLKSRQLKHKGAVAEVVPENQTCHGPRPNIGHMAARKKRRKLARLYQLYRLLVKQNLGDLSQAQKRECDNLQQNLFPNHPRVPLLLIKQLISSLKHELHEMERQTTQANLATWRKNMKDGSKQLSQWLKARESPGRCSLKTSDGSLSLDVVSDAQTIFDYWTNFWRTHDQNKPPLPDRIAAIREGAPSNPPQVQFPLPTGVELSNQAQDAAGTGGCDGWHSKELKSLPLPCFDLVADIIQEGIQKGQVPAQFLQSRMVCLPKGSKISSSGTIQPEDCRPITILSCFWRLWCSTLCQSPAVQGWCKSTFPQEIAAMAKNDLYTHLIHMFQNFHDQGYLLALDYTKAFDCLDPNVTKELLLAFGWNIKLVEFIHTIWDRQCRFVCWQNHVHSAPLRGPAQPQGDPLGPMIMSLWVLSGFNVIKRNVPINRSSTTLYLDDRTITCSSPEHLRDHWENWVHWSSRVGLIESVNKAVAVAAKPRFHDHLASVFEQDAVQVSGATKVLGAVTVSCPRPLADAESSRVASAVRVVRLLSTIGFTLAPFLRTVGQFALSKASFGWVGRGPTLAASGKLWTACWVASSRVHYSSPELRSVLFGGIYHLDCLWACRLVAALLRSSVHALPVWSLKFGTPSAALHGWLLHRGWVLVRPFVWSHAVGQCRLDLSRRVTPQLLAGLIGRARHDLRTGWRGWAFQRWCCSSRHELVSLPDPLPVFSRVNWSSAREWALSSASAATVCLGATYSPAHFRERDPSKAGCFWPGCSVSVAHFSHVFWECPCRVNPPVFPPGFALPPFLARFGWDCGEDADLVSAVRSWLCCVQDRLWDSRFSGRPPDPRS